MPRQKNYRTSNMCHTAKDIISAYNRRRNDILQSTPGGSVCYSDTGRATIFQFGRASINMVDLVKDKKFIIDEAKVNGKVHLILKESEKGISFTLSRKSADKGNHLDWKFRTDAAEKRSLVIKHFPKTPEHPRSPKFQAHFIEGHTPNDESIWIAILPAERRLV